MVAGQGAGEIAAAQAAGVLGLEDGLRLAAGDDPESAPEGVAIAAPSIGLVNGATGRLLEPGDATDAAFWLRQRDEPAPLAHCVDTLAALGVEAVIEIGPDAVHGPALASAWSASASAAALPVILASLRPPHTGETDQAADSDEGFVDAVAAAYEAGMAISFAGLFAGETRRRVSIPGYPFQRRRYWLPKPERHVNAPA